ncbi:MAG: hypothetical protein ACYCO3_16050 [Mycobacteriales bacterium]
MTGLLQAARSRAPAEVEDAVVVAAGIGLRAPRGWVVRAATFSAARGEVVAISERVDRGRRALLLTLAGRMRLCEGSGRVAGYDLSSQRLRVQALVGLGEIAGVNDLDGWLSVGELVGERAAICRTHPRYAWPRLDQLGLDLPTKTLVRDLDPAERVLFGVALATIAAPEVVVVDAVDAAVPAGSIEQVWGALRRLAASGTTVVAGCLDAGPAAVADVVVSLVGGAVVVKRRPAPPAQSRTPRPRRGAEPEVEGLARGS